MMVLAAKMEKVKLIEDLCFGEECITTFLMVLFLLIGFHVHLVQEDLIILITVTKLEASLILTPEVVPKSLVAEDKFHFFSDFPISGYVPK